MVIVQRSDFNGFQLLAKSNNTNVVLQSYIDRYERLTIYQLLGVDLGKLFIADLIPSTITLDDRGDYDASVGTFPATGGSGTAGAIMEGDYWTISVAGTLGTTDYVVGDLVYALDDAPAQTSTNWAKKELRFTTIYDAFTLQSDGDTYYGNDWANFWGYWCGSDSGGIYNSYGIKDILVSIIYYYYVAGTQVKQSQSGAVLNQTETGDIMSPLNAFRTAEIKWNEILNSIGAVQWYCAIYDPDTYPEYRGVIFKPQYSALL
ncbi:hypothetical protein UFOVP518_31 [uncultured Caudovirales phage]|uniref:Uncharacterized protein n=1 Tax=uncultured Caudovirales phage TaxID=2100421 RepID=A0A6J5MV46_9CAUD|nr:hypothetical protein UFOVP518_31 [uncultured Caudovirales phage]